MLVVRSILSLALVLGLVVIFGRLAKRGFRTTGPRRVAPLQGLSVESKLSLGKGQHIVVVRDRTTRMIVGVTSTQFTLLHASDLANDSDEAGDEVQPAIESIDLRDSADPAVALLSQWGERKPSALSGLSRGSWMAFLEQMRGARAQQR
jgi:flagellar biogenesis protein FliO